MTPEERKKLIWSLRLGFYIAFVLAYISAVIVFAVEYQNYWAAGGFAIVIGLICLRIYLYVTPPDELYRTFSPLSWHRAIYQGIFFCVGLAGVGVGLWLMSEGIKKHQRWTGDSYFCAMIGVWMAAKWAFFVTIPIYDLRPDTIEELLIARYGDKANEPFTVEEGEEATRGPSSPKKSGKRSASTRPAESQVFVED